MKQTLDNFTHLLEGLDIPVDIEEAVELYQEYDDVYSIAIVFVSQYGVLKKLTDKYPKLTPEDKVSFILEEIQSALKDFDYDYGVKLQTLVRTYVNRRCYAEHKMRTHDIRCIDYDPTINSSYELHVESHDLGSQSDEHLIELHSTLESMDLTENELKYCKIVTEDSHVPRDSDVAKIMGVTPAMINHIRKRLKMKFQPILVA